MHARRQTLSHKLRHSLYNIFTTIHLPMNITALIFTSLFILYTLTLVYRNFTIAVLVTGVIGCCAYALWKLQDEKDIKQHQ